MNRWTVLFVSVLFVAFLTMGCSGGGVSPVSPDIGPGLTTGIENHGAQGGEVLWGYYDLYFDLENGTVEAIPNRDVMFTANVTMFVNNNYSNLAFDIWGTPVDPGGAFVDVDIDVSISHPFPGLHQYDGWDVRGIFIGQGSAIMDYDGDLAYAIPGDQEMYDYDLADDPDIGYDDPNDGLVGNPDGYTRWWNAVEFGTGGPLGYVEGALATPGYQSSLTATLNPYKYFCDDLGVDDDLWTWLTTSPNPDAHGIFTAGATNTRNYYLRFPTPDPNVSYGYAIAATWGEAPGEPPPAYIENAVETIACTAGITDAIWYVDDTDNGGNLIADISLWLWDMDSTVDTEFILPSTVYVESDVIGGAVSIGGTPVGGGPNWSTYSCDIPSTNVTSSDMSEFWVIAEYENYDYTCQYPATAPDAPLAAFFRYDLYISDTQYCTTEVLSINPVDGPVDTAVNATITCTDVCDDVSLAALLRRTGETDIVGTVAYVDATSFTADFDLTGAAIGVWDVVVNDGCCSAGGTLVGGFEVLDIAMEIVPFAGSVMGDGPKDITVKGTDSSLNDGVGNPVPPHGDYLIDIGVRANDGGVFGAWAEYTTPWDGYTHDTGYIDRYAPDMNSVIASAPILQYDRINALPFSYPEFQLEPGGPGAGGIYGWAAQFGNTWISGEDDMLVCATDVMYGGNSNFFPTWDFWNGAGNFPWTYARPHGVSGCGDGTIIKHSSSLWYGTYLRNWGYVPSPTSNDWSWISSNIEGAMSNTQISTDFDGGYEVGIRAIAAGNTNATVFALTYSDPHILQYATWRCTSAIGTPFGPDGTDLEQISNPVDMTIRWTADRIYVLDEPAVGMTRIQCFDTAGTWLAASAVTDASLTGGGAPYRLDYNEFEDCLYVLYDNNTIEAWIDNSI